MKEQRGKKDLEDFPNNIIIKVEQASSYGKYLSTSKSREKGSHNHRTRRMKI